MHNFSTEIWARCQIFWPPWNLAFCTYVLICIVYLAIHICPIPIAPMFWKGIAKLEDAKYTVRIREGLKNGEKRSGWPLEFISIAGTAGHSLVQTCTPRYSQVQCWKDPSCSIFLKSRRFEDIKYDTERWLLGDYLMTTWWPLGD